MTHITPESRRLLREVWKTSRMETASFHRETEFFAGPEAKQFTEDVRSATRLWRESWITDPLEHILREAGDALPGPCNYCGKEH